MVLLLVEFRKEALIHTVAKVFHRTSYKIQILTTFELIPSFLLKIS